jgi:transposase-like protein
MLAVRWYLRYGLSSSDVAELLAERGITVDHVTIYRWVQRFTPELIDAVRPSCTGRGCNSSNQRGACGKMRTATGP